METRSWAIHVSYMNKSHWCLHERDSVGVLEGDYIIFETTLYSFFTFAGSARKTGRSKRMIWGSLTCHLSSLNGQYCSVACPCNGHRGKGELFQVSLTNIQRPTLGPLQGAREGWHLFGLDSSWTLMWHGWSARDLGLLRQESIWFTLAHKWLLKRFSLCRKTGQIKSLPRQNICAP